jgi:hypothetical protein
MYWTLGEAIKELEKRQSQRELMERIDEFLGSCPIPKGFNGFLARHIATARLEDIQFEERCKALGLCPINLEYLEDVFLPENPSKTRLVILYGFDGYGKNGGPRLKKVELVESLRRIKGIPLKKIKTKKSEFLWEFHHRARKIVGLEGEIIDISDWLKSLGSAANYYTYLFAAFSTRGILFESFESPGFPHLEIFKRRVVIPAWQFVVKEFGVKPLIVYHPCSGSEKEEEQILNFYPARVLEAL